MTPQPPRRIDIRDNRLAAAIIEQAVEYAILTMEFDGTITSWSPGAERMTGYTEDEIVGSNFSLLFTSSDRSAGEDRIELATTLRDGRAEDSRWHLCKNGGRFWANGMTMLMRDPDLTCLLKVMRDETPAKRADEQRVLLLNELNHRINNTLATVQSIAEQTLRGREVSSETRGDLAGRLLTLSEAHRVLVDENWAGADLHTILRKALAPHAGGESRIVFDGPDVRLSPPQAVSMALALHELATNALKYGSLTSPDGAVRIDWNLAHDGAGGRHLTFLWEEHGGPAVAIPTRRGFGTRLLARTFGEENGGRAEVQYNPSGLRCLIHLPLSTREEALVLDLAAEAGE
ncbi:HWE histidine kinase domain-containing protein [Phenylobacterium ferrooxidans]|uniref:histidine kinase n=1 Tax=Phenylobacterium ferrooxidans TaxID=2982689 RepID=A0ABW6CK30_9CAUL